MNRAITDGIDLSSLVQGQPSSTAARLSDAIAEDVEAVLGRHSRELTVRYDVTVNYDMVDLGGGVVGQDIFADFVFCVDAIHVGDVLWKVTRARVEDVTGPNGFANLDALVKKACENFRQRITDIRMALANGQAKG